AERVLFFLNAEKSGGTWQKYYVHTAARVDERAARSPECVPLMERVRTELKPVLGQTDAGGRCHATDSAADTVVIPLMRAGRLAGLLYADSPVSRRQFSKNDIDFLSTVGLQIAGRLGQIE